MRTILITGTDNAGPQDWWADPWIDLPWTDGGRIAPPLDRANAVSVENQYYEMAVLGQPDSIAIGLRTIHDAGWEHLHLLRETIKWFDPLVLQSPAPTLTPFIDTGWFLHAPGGRFDFANPGHLAWFWTDWLKPWFGMFPEDPTARNPIRWERTPDGRLLIFLWTNHEAVNRHLSVNLLIDIQNRMAAQGLGAPAFILHTSWPESDVRVIGRALGIHDWFDAAVSSWSITDHAFTGLRVGVTVPSFHDWRGSTIQPPRVIDGEDGKLLERNLARFRAKACDYVFIESYSNLIEDAGLYRLEPDGNDTRLRYLREHMQITRGAAVPAPIPFPPKKDDHMSDPEYVISMRGSFPHPWRPGRYLTWFPKGQQVTVLMVEDGKRYTRVYEEIKDQPNAYESWQRQGNRAVFDESTEWAAYPLVD